MSRILHSLTMIALGAILLAPWCLLQIHFYALYYGFRSKHFGIEHGRIGIVISILAYSSGAFGIGMIVFFCQDLLAVWGSLNRVAPFFTGLALSGMVAAWGVELFLRTLFKRKFLAFMERAEPRCERCQYILTGLRPVRKTLRCPECGHVEATSSVQERFRLDLKVADRDR